MSGRRALLDQTTLVAVALLAAVGCEGEPPFTISESNGSESAPQNLPEFGWRRALEQGPNAAEEALGSAEDCRPDRRLPALRPGIRGFFEDDPRKCDFPDPESPEARYFVDAILYSRDNATALVLRPTERHGLSAEVLEQFDIPEPPVRRRRIVDWGGSERAVLSFRVDDLRGKIDHGAPIAVDLVAEPDDPDRLAFVRVAVASSWPYSLDHVQLIGRRPIRRSMVLPRTNSGGRPGPGLYLEVGVDGFAVGPQLPFPIRRNGDDPEFAERAFEWPALEGDVAAEDPWRVEIEELSRRWMDYRRELGEVPTPVRYTLYSTQTAPYRRVARVVGGIASRVEAAFRVAGRYTETFDAAFDRFVRLRTVSVPFRAADAGSAPFAVDVTYEGFDLRLDGERVPPVEGCPDSGPTFCPTEQRDVAKLVERASSLQREENWAESDRSLRRALEAYDWRGLHNRLSREAADRAGAPTVALRPAPEVAFAVPFRLALLLQRRFSAPEGGRCLVEVPEEMAIEGARPCPEGSQSGPESSSSRLATPAFLLPE